MITPAYSPTATERVLPRMALDFTTGVLDSRVAVTRALNTATAVNSSGNIAIVNANLPRFDYNPVTLAPKGLLIEEARTNTAVYSNDVTGAGWSIGGLTTSTPTTSPDGTANAVLLLEDSSTGFHRAFQVPTTTAAAWTVTAFFKPAGRSWVWLRMSDSGGIKYAWFNVTTGVVGTVEAGLTATITPYKNGFYRCSITAATAAAGAAAVIFGTADADNSNSFTGDPAKGIYFYGLQVELGAFATSYIPTTTSSLTRNADVVTMTGTNFSDWYNAGEGTFAVVADTAKPTSLVVVAEITSVTDGTSNNRAITRFITASVESLVISAGVVGTQLSALYTVNTTSKLVSALKQNSFATAIGGATTILSGSGNMPVGANRLNIGGLGNLNGHVASIRYWPQRVTNSEVQAFSK